MRSYKKKRQNFNIADLSADELKGLFIEKNRFRPKRMVLLLVMICVCATVFFVSNRASQENDMDLISDGSTISLATVPVSAAGAKKDLISIPSGTVKANPFLPYRDIGSGAVSDVPAYELVAPPEAINESSDAARVMDTIVSGILYDKFSPSAILNIEGNDYLVKKGDVVNNYRVLNITQDSVTVKLGANVYKAGLGEILTEGSVNHNDVSNLSKKFGGER